ncbi:carbohydrate-responsive element-binding protein-like isoform X2 [Silurus meridionalis]|uniref:carbohydrate-responsive element-binding protein-like isoform X2 n=1 Tax=Silurus meridionalis TaxID=175797 RepID=UPI001EECCB44|nr:carbohydrate-responsive element-binding protein-like isoform X2 [Silurus meridionalis]
MAKLKKFPEPQNQTQIVDSESDSEQEDALTHAESVSSATSSETARRSQVIHSGHFMVSSPHRDPVARRRRSYYYDFDTVNKPRCQTYSFGPFSSGRLSIDPTLTRLFECMTLAYSGKIVSPKWKSFKGLKLLWRDKIRLNNGIWRAWFIQYVEKRKNPVCGFVTPLEGSEADAHRKPEAIVLEGSYWKRRIEVVIKEYHKWRIYYKKRKHKDHVPVFQTTPICRSGLEKWSDQMYPEPIPSQEEVHLFDLDCFLSDISDTLFTMTQKPNPWSEERHNTYTSNADMIQPGLSPLQPNLDDLMDIPDIFASYRGYPLVQSGYADSDLIESLSNAPFPSAPSTVINTPLIHTGSQLTQPNITESLPQSSSTVSLPCPGYPHRPLPCEMPFDTFRMASNPKFKGYLEFSEFHHSPAILPDMDSYGQSYSVPSIATGPSNISSASLSQENPYIYSNTCLKYRHASGIQSGSSVVSTPTVITHTGLMNALAQDPQEGQSYTMLDMADYQETSVAPPLQSQAHCFSVPQQVAVGSGRGKHKQKMGGGRGFPVATSVPVSVAPPTQTSCLAKLLSSSSQERKPTVGFNPPFVGLKCHRPTSPVLASTSSMPGHQRGSRASQHPPWPPAEVQCQMPMMVHSNVSHSSSISSLLVPKTEKLSPVQIHVPERTSLTVSFSGTFDSTSPTNPPEKQSENLTGITKTEHIKTDTRRITHISAEQKRRFNIKLGFDTLHSLVTTLSSQPSIKISKATTLQKTAEYISKMQQERAQLHEESQRLRDEILALNSAINMCQQQLPATGVPITRQRFDHMRERFREYVRTQTLQNWKFWIFSVIMEPLFESYNVMVSTTSLEEMCRTTLSWLDQHCSLPALRPAVLSSLRLLSTTTSILTDPSQVPEQATQAVTQRHLSHSCNQ